MPYRLLVLVLWAGLAAAASSSDDEWRMRWRTCADHTAGYAFRYPYEYVIPDQYAVELLRERRMAVRQVMVDGKRAFVPDESAPRIGVDLKGFSHAASALPVGVAATPEAIGRHMAKDARLALAPDERELTWKPFDYIRPGRRSAARRSQVGGPGPGGLDR